MPIRCENLMKSYGDKDVLNKFSAEFPDKGVTCLTAPSGAGKTTLLHLLAGIIIPDGGRIEGISGKRIAVAFQTPRLLPWLTAAQNVALVLGDRKRFIPEAIEWLAQVELEPEAGAYPDELSGGMKQRVSIARALAYGGDCVLLDEPFNGLDEALAHRIWEKIRNRFSRGCIICALHDLTFAKEIADNFVAISSGVTKEEEREKNK